MVAISEGSPVIRQVRLLNKGSSSWLNVNDDGIVRLNDNQDGYEELMFVSEKVGKMKIYGVKSNRWLCYKKNWRLVGKLNGTEGRLGDRCVFSEDLYENYYYIYRSMADTKKLLGFKKTGAPTRGWVKNNQPTEVHFFSKIDEKFNHELSRHNEIKSTGGEQGLYAARSQGRQLLDPQTTSRRQRQSHNKHRLRHKHSGRPRRRPADNDTAAV